jgi:hypothetical protein
MSDTDDIDPSIAALLAEAANSLPESNTQLEAEEAEIEEKKKSVDAETAKRDRAQANEVPPVDLSVQHFNPVSKYFEDKASPVFDDPNYYKIALTGEGESAQRLHQVLVKYLNCTDPKDRTVYRQQIVSSYWGFITNLAPKMANITLPQCKRMLMRFGVVLPSLFSPEQKDFFSRSIMNNTTGEPIFYMDEWMKEIAAGRLTLSATDETPANRAKGPAADQQRIQQLKSKNSGKLQSAESLVNAKESERSMVEQEISERIKMLFDHPAFIGLEPHRMPYNEMQKKLFLELADRFRHLQKVDRELSGYLKEFQEAKDIEGSLEQKATEIPEETVSVGKDEINTEINSVRQMAKMTVGRQGNQFPVFTREFFHCFDKSTGFRENVLRELSWIESIDPQVFCRVHKNMLHRIVPYVLLVPTYGDTGFCWEPFDRYNRVTSRGRIIIPMYPRDLKIACLTAVADLRWQVAKEKASYYWMEEGLTGQYYQWIDSQKLKGDLKAYFIADYVLWMTKEADGVQRLSKEVRAIFWRFLPFPQAKKDELKMRSVVYQELYQRDLNRSMSDGY